VGFERVRDALETMLSDDPAFSAQLSVIWRGETVVDLAGGPDLDGDSVTGVFSASKGVAATVIGLLLDRGLLELDRAVVDYWPEFGEAGKSEITVREVLSHRAGVVGVSDGFEPDDVVGRAAAAKIAASAPWWHPGSMHGYHALTIGVVMEELVRRVTPSTLQEIYEDEIRAPRSLDFYLGFPESAEVRFRPVLPPRADPASDPGGADDLRSVAFNAKRSASDPVAGALGPNDRRMRAAGFSSIDGIGSARGLAGVYAALLEGPGRTPLLSRATIDEMSREHSFGLDRILGVGNAFGIVFMKPQPALDFGSYRAYGHDGAGGVLAFADPMYDLAFAYIPMPMQVPGGAGPTGVRMSRLVRAAIRDLA
jgi:CubicO group peptidase (beta-lactamase class C family)